MIKLETLSGQPYDNIYLNETDSKYSHILENIKRPDYPEYNPSKFQRYTMYVKTDIKLFNKGKLINFDDDISFDKDDSVLQIFIKYEYICGDKYRRIYTSTEENLKERITNLITQDIKFINLLKKEEQTEELCRLAVQQNGLALKYVKNQTEEICKLAVQQNVYALEYVKIEQTEEICKLAVQEYGYVLQFVKEQTEEICKLAVQEYGYVLQFVKEQTEEICKLAVQQNGNALQYVKKQTEKICKLAVQQHPSALCYVPEHMKHLFM